MVSNSAGSVTSTPALLQTTPPLIIRQPEDYIAALGETVDFSVDVSGPTPFTYEWQKDGDNIPDATNRVFTIVGADYTNAGNYRVIVSNPLGTEVSHYANLSITDKPIVELLSYTPAAATVRVRFTPGKSCILQATTDFVTWVDLTVTAQPVPFTHIDTDVSLYPHRFYRAKDTTP